MALIEEACVSERGKEARGSIFLSTAVEIGHGPGKIVLKVR
jgi:hypothetical protein